MVLGVRKRCDNTRPGEWQRAVLWTNRFMRQYDLITRQLKKLNSRNARGTDWKLAKEEVNAKDRCECLNGARPEDWR
jgi:hypothetical protein